MCSHFKKTKVFKLLDKDASVKTVDDIVCIRVQTACDIKK